MVRVLHLIDRDTPAERLAELALLAGVEDILVSLGPPPRGLALPLPVHAEHRPLGSVELCALRLGRLARQTGLVHAWSAPAAMAAKTLAQPRTRPGVVSLSSAAELSPRLVDALCDFSQPLVLTMPAEPSRRAAVAAGVFADCTHVLPPIAEPIAEAASRRRRVREQLGLADDQVLLAAPSELVRAGGHKHAIWIHAILLHLMPRVRLVIPGDGPARPFVETFSATTRFGHHVFLTGDRLPLADVLAASDLALFLHDRDCGLGHLAAAMAAGLPIVASSTPDICSCLTDARDALLVPPGVVRKQADAVLKLLDDPAMARRLGKSAAARAAEQFAPALCRRQLAEVYQAAARVG